MHMTTIFCILWSHIALLQIPKLYSEGKNIVALILASVIVLANLFPRSMLTPLTLVYSAVLWFTGSQSNHVFMALFVNAAYLCTFSFDKRVHEQKFIFAVRLTVAALYLITGVHKLNYDWFDPRYSCATQMMAGSLYVVPLVPEFAIPSVLNASPYIAVIMELSLAVLWMISNLNVRRITALLGSGMHLVLAFPPSPMSVYPFSVLMAPLYLCLVPEGAQAVGQALLSRPLISASFVGICVAVSCKLNAILGLPEELFEYPAYGCWSQGQIWNLAAWMFIISSAIVAGSPWTECVAVKSCLGGKLVALAVILFGALPYLGLRTYPALAMFSNLRVEGERPNHLLLTPVKLHNAETVTIVKTDLPELDNLQVDLGEFFHDDMREFFEKFNVSAEFHIVPPKWSVPGVREKSNDGRRRIHVPLVEVRRRVSKALKEGKEFFVEYEHEGELKEFDSLNGTPRDGDLHRPLGWWEERLLRYRTFDPNYSPCRH